MDTQSRLAIHYGSFVVEIDLMPKVSIIMPVYNGARFIGQAIGSVLAQTWQDWQLLVIDDGSTDDTPELLARFADLRVTVVRQENQGESVARNAGLELVEGKYVAFLDADDLYLPNALADLAAYLDAHPAVDVVLSDGYFCDERGRPLMRLSEHRPGPYTGDILEPLVLNPSVISGIICTMTRRAAIERADVRFDPALVIGPDWDFWIHLARHARFGYLDKLTCMYRIHQINVTRTSGHKRRRDDLVRGRVKVMNSSWFADLSIPTRREFFYNLLVGLLSEAPEQQQDIFTSPAFHSLSDPERARLLRLVATNHLLRGVHLGFAQDCLLEALVVWPRDRKSQLLLSLMSFNPRAWILVLTVWRNVVEMRARLRSVGYKRSKPVPVALAPQRE